MDDSIDTANGTKARILIADDERSIANAVAAMMEMSGMEAIIAGDGNEANEALMAGEADAAILDVMMPGMNGFEVLQAARRRGDMTPVLMLTALTTIDDKMNGFESGADDYLPKPFDMRELVARVSILAKRQSYSSGTVDVGGVKLNLAKSTVSNGNGASLPMSDIENAITSYLNAHRPAVRIGRLAEVATRSTGSDVTDGTVRLAAATATSKLRQLGSTVSIAVEGDSLVITDSANGQNDASEKANGDKADRKADSQDNTDSEANTGNDGKTVSGNAASGDRKRPQITFPWNRR